MQRTRASVTDRAPSSTLRAGHSSLCSYTFGKMKPLYYYTGEIVAKGDFVKLGQNLGRILHIGSDLKDWGLPNNDYENMVIIESPDFGLVCESVDSCDLLLISRAG